MSNLTEYQACLTPDDAVISQLLELFGSEGKAIIKRDNLSKVDFAFILVKMAVKIAGLEMREAFDLMFGKGNYDKFIELTYKEVQQRLIDEGKI